jgi:hypothetical protein
MGNRSTIKAAGYVKELCLVALFGLERLKETGAPSLVLNVTMDPAPTVEQMVDAILEVAGKRRTVWNVPRSLLLALSYPTSAVASMFGINSPINPVRVRKLFRSNNVAAEQLRNHGYQYTARQPAEALKWERPHTMVPDVPKS